MIENMTRTQAIAAVPGLSERRLAGFAAADLFTPDPTAAGPMFRPIDVARLALLCDLADHFDLEDDALGVVIGLIDQLHIARARLFAMAQAIEAEPQDLRHRVGMRLVGILSM